MLWQLITPANCQGANYYLYNGLFECRIKGPAETAITSHVVTKATFSVCEQCTQFILCIEIHFNLFGPMFDLKVD